MFRTILPGPTHSLVVGAPSLLHSEYWSRSRYPGNNNYDISCGSIGRDLHNDRRNTVIANGPTRGSR
jgi:hypothetical protein